MYKIYVEKFICLKSEFVIIAYKQEKLIKNEMLHKSKKVKILKIHLFLI